MTIDDALATLECDIYSSKDDIKSAFRRLSKAYHPDTTGSSDSTKLRLVIEAWTFLKSSDHRPRVRPKETKGLLKFFRLLNKHDGELVITLPIKTLEEDAVIICMWGSTEFNVHLEKGTTFPKIIEIKNIRRHPVRMTIQAGDDFYA
jgi:hypothetical protein